MSTGLNYKQFPPLVKSQPSFHTHKPIHTQIITHTHVWMLMRWSSRVYSHASGTHTFPCVGEVFDSRTSGTTHVLMFTRVVSAVMGTMPPVDMHVKAPTPPGWSGDNGYNTIVQCLAVLWYVYGKSNKVVQYSNTEDVCVLYSVVHQCYIQ